MRTKLNWIKSLRESDRLEDLNSGQVIVLLAVVAIGLIAMMGLAIDGGRLLFLRRDTQNAADAAAVAAARALCTARDPAPFALAAADANGFDNDRTSNWVDIYSPPIHTSFSIPSECVGCYVEVNVKAQIPPTFIGLVYGGDLAASGHAIGTCNPDLNNVGNKAPELRAMWAMGECSPASVAINGSSIYIEGGAHSNSSMNIEASAEGGSVVGATSVVEPKSDDTVVQNQDKIHWSAGDTSGGDSGGSTSTGTCSSACFTPLDGDMEVIPADGKPYVTSKKTEYPVDYKIEDFQLPDGGNAFAADAVSQYYEFPCTGRFWDWVKDNHLTGNKMDDGIYYAACDIEIKDNENADNVTGNVTIVSTGSIQIHGDGQEWEPYTENLILFSNANEGCTGMGAVKFSGSNNSWNGIVFAPRGTIKMSASTNNSQAGCLVGLSVEVSGSTNSIICHIEKEEVEPEPGIWLSE